MRVALAVVTVLAHEVALLVTKDSHHTDEKAHEKTNEVSQFGGHHDTARESNDS
jgi:hypothetical protein